MSAVRFEAVPRAAGKQAFYSVGASLVEAEGGALLLRRFFPEGVVSFDPKPGREHSDQRFVDRWLEFFRGEVRYLLVEDAELGRAEAFVEHVMEEMVNRPDVKAGDVSRSKDHGGRWKPYGGQAPVVVSERSTCYGCGKVNVGSRMDLRPETLGWHLEIGPYEVPCCKGKDDGLKKECRLKAVDRLSCCPSCGALNKVKPGKVCGDCIRLVDEGERARAARGTTAMVELGNWSDPFVPYDLRKRLQLALEGVLVSMGGRSYGNADRVSVPELAVPEVRYLIEAVNAAVDAGRKDGIQKGTDLLGGLAEGRVSVNDFNAKTGR